MVTTVVVKLVLVVGTGDADDNVAGYAGSIVVIMVDDGTLHFCWHYCLSSSPEKESKDHSF